MKVGFLLGAGFSKYFGLPLANEFVKTAGSIIERGLWNRHAPSRNKAIFQKIIGFSEIVSAEEKREINNIEELLFFADKRKFMALSLKDPWANIESEIRQAIFEILTVAQFQVFESNEGYQVLDTYLRFLDLVERTGRGPIVTLNYDCLLEILLTTANMSNGRLRNELAARVKFNYEIGKTFQAIDICEPIAEISYFKLHGAYNWQKCEKHGLQECSGPLRTSVRGTCKLCQGRTEPYIIYPEIRKKITEELNSLWSKAFELLKSVEKLVVIGVKFNPLDSDLFEKACELNKKGISFIIVDPSALELSRGFPAKTIPIVTEQNTGAKFEDIFGFRSESACDVFQKTVGTEIRKLKIFEIERPGLPFFVVPLRF